MRRLPALVSALLVVALSGCNNDFAPQYLVKDLRILSLRAHVQGSTAADGTPPSGGTPGDTLVLEALVGNPAGRTVTVTWYGCAPTPDQSLPPCADPEFLRDPTRLASDPRVLALGTGLSVSVPLPDVTAALNFVIGLAEQQPTYQCSLYAEMPIVAVVEGDGRQQVAQKGARLVPPVALVPPEIAGGYVANFNPDVLEVVQAASDANGCAGGSAVDAGPFPPGSLFLCGLATPGSIEPYKRCDADGKREDTTETLFWQWYVTGGEFPDTSGVKNATGDSIKFVRPAGPFTLWAILRDGRGGEAWARYRCDDTCVVHALDAAP